MVDVNAERPGGWALRPTEQDVVLPLDLEVSVPLPGWDPAPRLSMVFADDGAYVPAVTVRPGGAGPHPAVVCVHGGTGGLGHSYLLDQLTRRGWLFEALLADGYAICVTEGRREIEDAYGQGLPCPLDHHDLVRVIAHVRSMADIDPDRVGYLGVSHGGELGLKAMAAMGSGLRAAVLSEPAVIEFLGLHLPTAERGERDLQFHGEVGDDEVDVAWALERIGRIDPQTSMLVCGRDGDHLQGLFRKCHELLERSGLPVSWQSWDHPDHVFQWGPPRGAEGYEPDDIQRRSRDQVLTFLERSMGPTGP